VIIYILSMNFETVSIWIGQESHEEAAEELPSKAKFFFSAAVESWDAEFYVKVEDNINLDLGNFFYVLCVC